MNRLRFFILTLIVLAQIGIAQVNLVTNLPPPPQNQNRPLPPPPPQQRLNPSIAMKNNQPPPPPQEAPIPPNNNLRPQPQPQPQPNPNPSPNPPSNDYLMALNNWRRSFDGTGNNQKFTNWGSTGQPQSRYCPNNYEDGLSVMRSDLPNPRELSNVLGNIRLSPGGVIQLSKQNRNMLFPIWGQFLDHDIALTSFADTEPVPMKVPKCDKFFDPTCTGTQELPFMRSAFDPNQALRTQINLNTAWIDGSQVYGSSKQNADALRTFSKGKLLTSEKNLLPQDDNGFYISGDIRTNQNIGLTVLHTIFLREHNRICDILSQKSSSLTDEDIYQMARNYVVALIQKISFEEFLPGLLGQTQMDTWIGPYIYQSNLNPDLFTEFNTAGYRIGHSLMNSPYKLIDNQGNILKRLNFGETFNNPDLVNDQSLASIMNGLLRVNYKERSLELIDDLRNFLVSGQFGSLKIDLFAANVQRGRDHGICSYKTARDQINLPNESFESIFDDPESGHYPASVIKERYGSLDKVDLWIGIIGQKSMTGSDMGKVGGKMIAAQFKKIRNADKLWYENVMAPFPGLLKEIKNTSLGDLIKRNSRVSKVESESFNKVM